MLTDHVLGQTWKSRLALVRATLSQSRLALVVSDPHQDDNPLIAVNEAFCQLTGYDSDEVLGYNCRFLQGSGTNRGEVERLASAVAKRRTVYVELLNYRKDGTPFWNALHVGPVHDDDGELIHFFGTQWDVTDKVEAMELLRGRTQLSDERLSDVAGEVRHLREALAAEREAGRERLAAAQAERDAWREHAQALAAQIQGRFRLPWLRPTAQARPNGGEPPDPS